jgi:hypothetical protein
MTDVQSSGTAEYGGENGMRTSIAGQSPIPNPIANADDKSQVIHAIIPPRP